jgi:6-phosphofructokinase 1
MRLPQPARRGAELPAPAPAAAQRPAPRAAPGGPPPRRAAAPPPPRVTTKFVASTPGDSSDVADVLQLDISLRDQLTPRPSPFVTHNNYGGGFVSEGDRVALASLRFASAASIGATCADVADGSISDAGDGDEVCVPLPTWAARAGARETIYFDPARTRAAIVTCGG